MGNKDNVIDLGLRRKLKNKTAGVPVKSHKASVLDITEMRQEIIEEERREVKRTILTGFIGAYIVVPEKGLIKVDIYDMSVQGLAFDLEGLEGQFKVGEVVAVRIYMNQKTYMPFLATINNSRSIPEEHCFRHGASYVEGTVNEKAIFHFVKFMENMSASLQTDTGDVMVSSLSK